MYRFLIVAACIASGAAMAASPTPPAWRGTRGTSYLQWAFGTATNPAAPDTNTSSGNPVAAVIPGPFSTGWIDTIDVLGGAQGIWDLGSGGTITIQLPAARPMEYSEVWVQASYLQDMTVTPEIYVSGAELTGTVITTLATLPAGGSWRAIQTQWTFPHRAEQPTVTVKGSVEWGSVIDEVSIDSRLELAGDLNTDCVINLLDLIMVRNLLGADVSSGTNWKADVNRDGYINILDLLRVRNLLSSICK